MRSMKPTAQTKVPKTLPTSDDANHLDTTDLDPTILNMEGLSAAINERDKRRRTGSAR